MRERLAQARHILAGEARQGGPGGPGDQPADGAGPTRGRAGFDAASAAARAFSRRDRMTRSSTMSSAISTPRPATA